MKSEPHNYRPSSDMSQLTRQMQMTSESVSRLCSEIDKFITLTGKISAESTMLRAELSNIINKQG